MTDVVIETKNLTKHYHIGPHVVRALRDVSLTVAKGEFVAVTGTDWGTCEVDFQR